MARIRVVPEDFRVDEIPLFEPSGEGAHTYVCVEKRLRTTEEVARALARAAGCKPRDVGYAGRKDRVAVTTQWLSVPGLDPAQARGLDIHGVRVLDAVAHAHKLRTGQLRGNRFAIVVRDVAADERARCAQRFERLCEAGMPNRFGPQRFGRDGDNAQRAASLLRGESRVADRRHARFLVSALQAAVFNDVLAARPGPLGVLEAGDVAIVHASGGPFLVEDVGLEQPRADAFEISPSGPIFGTRILAPAGEVARREHAALEARGLRLDALSPPRGVRLRGTRRALRVRPANPTFEARADGFALAFELPAGSYASVLVAEVLGAEPGVGASDDTSPSLAVS